uniref:Uncharacterized protein n=1 Tax=Rhizophora mucronata TaxID=61149 RepID=A0A2P2MKD5_RHIMU
MKKLTFVQKGAVSQFRAFN